MFRPRAYIKTLAEWAKVSVIEYNSVGDIIGVVLDIDQEHVVDLVDGYERTESTPYWEIDKITLSWPSGLYDRTKRQYYTDDVIVDGRTGYEYTVEFSDGSFWAEPTSCGYEGYTTRLLSDINVLSRIVGSTITKKCEE